MKGVNIKSLRSYESNGLLISSKHHYYDLTIWNYSRKTQYDCEWDDITIMCRGLITDSLGNIVGRPFKKFFNVGERNMYPTLPIKSIYEKVDGSLIIVYYYDGSWHAASRGSFNSIHAKRANMLLGQYLLNKDIKLNLEFTYIFEIIGDDFRIVVDYKCNDTLTLLGSVHTQSGVEYGPDETDIYNVWPSVANCYNPTKYDSIDKIKENLFPYFKSDGNISFEGVIILDANGKKWKIKDEEYLKVHKDTFNLSTITVYESFINGTVLDVPDELDSIIQNEIEKLKDHKSEILGKCRIIFNEIIHKLLPDVNRSNFSKLVLEYDKKYSSILFSMYDNNWKRIDEILNRMIKPKYKKI